MVSYCCVKGCSNNSNNKKKDPNSIISFHAFPSNSELKLKWLRAIGRPKWDSPTHARICSAHFDYNQINHDGCRTRIKDDAYPVNALPPNSNFEASDVQACRICLATDLKIYSLHDGILRTCIESFTGFNEGYNIEGLPHFVCYQCAAHLIKYYSLFERSIIAKATLLDIFAQNGEITINLIKLNQKQHNLKSLLSYCKLKTDFEIKHDCEDKSSYIIKNDFISNEHPDNDFKSDMDYKHGNTGLNLNLLKTDTCLETKNCDFNEIISDIKNDQDMNEIADDYCDDNYPDDFKMNSPIEDAIVKPSENKLEDELKQKNILKRKNDSSVYNDTVIRGSGDKNMFMSTHTRLRSKLGLKKQIKKNPKEINGCGLTPSEMNMQKYFTIVKLSLEEQIEDWDRTPMKRHLTGETLYECKTCSKYFANINSYKSHTACHDPSRGKYECPVCKLRFKNDVIFKSHVNRAHSKKFYCKTCPKVFNNVGVAKKHQRWHDGYMYKCSKCPFSSAHESALGAHARRQHEHALACAACGLAFVSRKGLKLHRVTAHRDMPETEVNGTFSCEQCNLNFSSEGARRVHLLTSSQHKRKIDLCDTKPRDPTLKNTCSKCGIEFTTVNELILHTKLEHPRPAQKKTSWRLPDDSYPTQCEHCGETVNNRKEHWWHVRRQHPKEKHSYRPVITAICDTCGKGFQNSTKLHLHELRHRNPTVRCDSCPRLFYDKYALARHSAVHEATRPHQCRTCGRAFKLRGNLDRHSRVHTGATPYECNMCGKKFKYSTSVNLHVRTVHYKMPHPPRKKRMARTARNSALAEDNNDNL